MFFYLVQARKNPVQAGLDWIFSGLDWIFPGLDWTDFSAGQKNPVQAAWTGYFPAWIFGWPGLDIFGKTHAGENPVQARKNPVRSGLDWKNVHSTPPEFKGFGDFHEIQCPPGPASQPASATGN